MTVSHSECWAIVPAGGTGQRFTQNGHCRDKLLEPVGGVPMLLRTVRALMAATRIKGVVIAVHPDRISAYRRLLAEDQLPKPFKLAEGGATRCNSVYNGLCAVPPQASMVAVHYAARPLIDPVLVDRAIAMLETGNAAGVLVALPVFDTVKCVDEAGHILETLDRRPLWRAQTPQVIDRQTLMDAYRWFQAQDSSTAIVTDDVQLLELAGFGPVKICEGSPDNLKITTPADLALAESLIKAVGATVC